MTCCCLDCGLGGVAAAFRRPSASASAATRVAIARTRFASASRFVACRASSSRSTARRAYAHGMGRERRARGCVPGLREEGLRLVVGAVGGVEGERTFCLSSSRSRASRRASFL